MKSLNELRCLIVDDSDPDARLLQILLRDLGITDTTRVCSVVEMQEEMGMDDDYDLILLDIYLPDMRGIEVIEKAREVTSLPIIVVTGYEFDNEEMQDKWWYEVENVLHKNALNGNLRMALTMFLRNRRRESESVEYIRRRFNEIRECITRTASA